MNSLKDMVKDNKKVKFIFFKEKECWYTTECGFEFPVPISDIGSATLLAEDKALLFMRYIRKYVAMIEEAKRQIYHKLENDVTKIELQLYELEQKQKKLVISLEKQRANKQFRCGCGKMHRIKDCVVIQAHYYVPPSGCTEGAYWTPTELQIICPDTDTKNRLLFDNYDVEWSKRDYYDYNASEQFKRIYKHLFKEVIDDYKEDRREWWNNFYIDKHHEKFGLCVKGRKYK